jgi:integrase
MLTEIAIKKITVSEKRREFPDGKITGLYLVVQPSGAKSWALRYRAAGAPRKLTIGPYPAIDIGKARGRAQEALGEVAGGKDPAAQKKAVRAAAKAEREADVDRVERVVALFIERYAKPITRDWKETERILTREVRDRWKGRRLSQITRAHVIEMLEEIVDRGSPGAANRIFAHFRKMCRWSVGRGYIERSPCDGLTAPSPERQRDRVLDDAEIKLAWEAFKAVGWPFGHIARLLLLTGARRDEIADMRWDEIDLTGRTLSLPAARTKNKRAHVIPLSGAAMRIIEALPRRGGTQFVFTTTGSTPVSGFSAVKKAIDAHIVAALGDGIKAPERWTFHDLRRTLATNLQKLGVRLEVTEAVLNHTSLSRGGIEGVYQRHDFADEKRAALEAWTDRLAQIVGEDAR